MLPAGVVDGVEPSGAIVSLNLNLPVCGSSSNTTAGLTAFRFAIERDLAGNACKILGRVDRVLELRAVRARTGTFDSVREHLGRVISESRERVGLDIEFGLVRLNEVLDLGCRILGRIVVRDERVLQRVAAQFP